MSLPMLADFAIRLAGGLAALLLLTPWRVVPPAFFRTHCQIMLGLNVLASLAVARSDAPGWATAVAITLAVLSFVTTIGWGLGLLRIGIPGCWAVVALSTLLLVVPGEGQPLDVALLNGASRLASAFLLGSTLTAMLLGHYYLTAPAMSIDPLVRFVRCMAIGLALRIVLGGIALWLVRSHPSPSFTPLFVSVRWGMGFLAVLVATVLSWKTVEIRSTQSATGILYIGMTLVLFGELTSLILAGRGGVLI